METLFSSVPEITLYEKLKALIQEYNFDKFITLTEIESIGNFSSYYSRYKLDGVVNSNEL